MVLLLIFYFDSDKIYVNTSMKPLNDKPIKHSFIKVLLLSFS